MDSITQFRDTYNSFSKLNFDFSRDIETLLLLKTIPDSLSEKLENSEFLHHLNEAIRHLEYVCEYMNIDINPELRKIIHSLKKSDDKMIPYADFRIDKPPVFREITPSPQQLSFEDILKDREDNGNPVSPVKRIRPIEYQGCCVNCGADNKYLYIESRTQQQYGCKVCGKRFTVKSSVASKIIACCPHCNKALERIKERGGYNIYKCKNEKCSFYLNNKKLKDEGKAEHLKNSSGSYSLHYIYRDFMISRDELEQAEENIDSSSRLSRIHHSQNVLGLILTFYVNYGLSSRKTALIMHEVFGIELSHQTVINYATLVSSYIKPLIDRYPYRLGSTLSGDETYIKVKGKNNYVFFFSDPSSKIITSYTIYEKRDTRCAIETIYHSLMHYDVIPEDLVIITDGNPIYNAAQNYFYLTGIDYTLQQVIGVRNSDETSRQYRPVKQIQERLNRTYKMNYYGTNGYGSLECANSYMVLFVAFFNFLRQHSSLGYRTPVDDNLFESDMHMQDRWIRLIQMSLTYHNTIS